MKKKLKALLGMLLCILFLFVGCAVPGVKPTQTTKPQSEVQEESGKVYDPQEAVTVSAEVAEQAQDVKEQVENGEDLETDEKLKSTPKEESTLEDELEPDGTVKEENISYDGTNTGKGTKLLGKYQGLTYYSQMDSRWGSIPYTSCGDKSQTIKSSGCGPTSAAMIVTASKGTITPPVMAQLAKDNGYRTTSNGTAWGYWSFIADFFNFDYFAPTYSYSTMIQKLKTDKNKDGISDYFVVVSCGYGLFTTGGHYITLMGFDGKIIVYDPYYYAGKFDTASRRAAKVTTKGNIAYVTESAFKTYANAQCYWIYSNDSAKAKKAVTENKSNQAAAKAVTTTMYVATQSSPLNVRAGAGKQYKILASMPRGTKVIVSKSSGGWSCITSPYKGWVDSQYLSKTKPSTVKVAYVYIPATGRMAYCNYSAIEKYNSYYRLRAKTTLYSKSNLTGTQYTYLAKTKVVIKKTI